MHLGAIVAVFFWGHPSDFRKGCMEATRSEVRGPGFPTGGGEQVGLRFLTREELAEVLQVSLRTVDAMVAAGENLRMSGWLGGFVLLLTVAALRSPAAEAALDSEVPAAPLLLAHPCRARAGQASRATAFRARCSGNVLVHRSVGVEEFWCRSVDTPQDVLPARVELDNCTADHIRPLPDVRDVNGLLLQRLERDSEFSSDFHG